MFDLPTDSALVGLSTELQVPSKACLFRRNSHHSYPPCDDDIISRLEKMILVEPHVSVKISRKLVLAREQGVDPNELMSSRK